MSQAAAPAIVVQPDPAEQPTSSLSPPPGLPSAVAQGEAGIELTAQPCASAQHSHTSDIPNDGTAASSPADTAAEAGNASAGLTAEQAAPGPAASVPSPQDLLSLLPACESSTSTVAVADDVLDGVFREWAAGMQPPAPPQQHPPADPLHSQSGGGGGGDDSAGAPQWTDIPEGGHDIVLFMGLTGPQQSRSQPPRPVPVAPSAEPIMTDDTRRPSSPGGASPPCQTSSQLV